jgi:nucleoside-diphosphate-sugar epimerase
MSKRVLVTGAGGFIGSHLTAALAQRGSEVVALDVDVSGIQHLDGTVQLLEGDVGDSTIVSRALDGVQAVFHLAAAHRSVLAPESEYRRVNVDAVAALAVAAREAGVERFVHCSTVGVYGRLESPPANEDSVCRPELAYERTKLEGEEVIRRAVREDGLPAVVLRPSWVYGPGCPRTDKILRAAASGRLVLAGSGARYRHCIYVRDMVEAFLRAESEAGAVGRTLIIGDARAVTVRDLLEEAARVTGGRAPRRVPLALLLAAAAAIEAGCRLVGQEPPISRRSLRFFTANTAFDTTLSRGVLGLEPRYDLAAGLGETHRLLARRRPWRVLPSDYAET